MSSGFRKREQEQKGKRNKEVIIILLFFSKVCSNQWGRYFRIDFGARAEGFMCQFPSVRQRMV